jgi:hypothetical protein
MPRKMISGNAYPVQYRGQLIKLAIITTDAAAHYFAAEETDYAGNHYLPWLVIEQPIHRYRSLQADSATISLQNADGELEILMAAERFEGAGIVLLDLFTELTGIGGGLPDACELLHGILNGGINNSGMANGAVASWNIVPAYDPTTIGAPPRIYATDCSNRFRKPMCGYTAGVDPNDPGTGLPYVICTKDFAACTARGRTHRYTGFVHVTLTTTAVYPPAGGRVPGGDGDGGISPGAGRGRRAVL